VKREVKEVMENIANEGSLKLYQGDEVENLFRLKGFLPFGNAQGRFLVRNDKTCFFVDLAIAPVRRFLNKRINISQKTEGNTLFAL
jgi:hypothetical protein